MNIQDLLSASRVNFNLQSTTKSEVINELIAILDADGKLSDKEQYKIAVLHREKEFSTGIGMGIAIPHAKQAAAVGRYSDFHPYGRRRKGKVANTAAAPTHSGNTADTIHQG